jgi:tetratricopeptide (TPR) repeat protein
MQTNSSELEFRKAIELEPGSADIWAAYSDSYLTPMRRLDEAVEADQKSIELDPLSPAWQYNLGYRLMLKGQYNRAIEYIKYALELDPQFPWAYMMLGFIHSKTGHQDESVREYETGVHHGGNIPVILGFLGLAENWSGRICEAQKLLGKLEERARKEYIAPSNFGHINLGMGDIDKAFEWYEKAIEERDPVIRHLHVAPMYDPLRSHPRYKALLRKMNLEP